MDEQLDLVVRELAPRIVRYGVARLRDQSLAEEVAQECLAALIRHWRKAGPPDSPEAFVFAIARRRLGRMIWRRRVWAPMEEGLEAAAPTPCPEGLALARDRAALVRKALATLPRRDRETILMVAVAELSMADAARALGISVSAVKMRLHRARARLAGALDGLQQLTSGGADDTR